MNEYRKLKIAIVGTKGLPANYGGFETLAEQLTMRLFSDFQFYVYCSKPSYNRKPKEINRVKLLYVDYKANGYQSAFYDILSIHHASKFCDVILILGISGCIYLPIIKQLSTKKFIVNLDGIEWKRDKWSFVSRLFLRISEYIAVNFADVLISDNIEIKKYINNQFKKNSVYIPYGGDFSEHYCSKLDLTQYYPTLVKRFAFSVCRIEPENNIHIILQSFSKMKDFQIMIVGNWNDSRYGRVLKKKYGDYNNIILVGAIYKKILINQLRSKCTWYIHGHSAGGTNPSLVEAMAFGCPVLAYDVSFNRSTTNNEALYFKTARELIDLVMNTPNNKLFKIGKYMRKLADSNYSWDFICKQYANLFKSIYYT